MDGRSALIVYSFAPKNLPSYPDLCSQAHHHLNRLWRNCDALGINQKLREFNVPTTFPTTVDTNHSVFRVLAAKVNLERSAKGDDYLALLFEYQDVIGFVATLEIDTPVGDITTWKALLQDWSSNGGSVEVPNGIMEETYLFSALHDSNRFLSERRLSKEDSSIAISNLGKKVSEALTSDSGPQWRVTNPYISDAGYCIWGGEQLNARRTVALIAPQKKKDDLFSWTVWSDVYALAPFARYLMHTAKLRFAQQVFEREIAKLRNDSRNLDKAVGAFVSACKRSAHDGTWKQDEITAAHNELVDLRTKTFDLIHGMSKLNELNLTGRIAARNMRNLVPQPWPELEFTNNTLFERDRELYLWMNEQIQMELRYLSALKERIAEGHKAATILLERENQKTSRRLKDLVLVQGTLIGSIAIGLAALQALQAFAPVTDTLWALLLLLMGIALALPILLERWHDRYTVMDRIAGGLFGAATLFFVTTLLDKFWLHLKTTSVFYYVLLNVVVCIVGFLLAYFGVGRLEGFKSSIQQQPRSG